MRKLTTQRVYKQALRKLRRRTIWQAQQYIEHKILASVRLYLDKEARNCAESK